MPARPADPAAVASWAAAITATKLRAVQAILADAELDHSAARQGAHTILEHLNQVFGLFWPADETVAGALSMSLSTVRRNRRRLVERGYYMPVAQGGGRRADGSGRTNYYSIDWARFSSATCSPVTTQQEAPAESDDLTAATCSPVAANVVTGDQPTCSPVTTKPIEGNPSINVIDRARERATGGDDDGGVAAVAAPRQVEQRVADRQPANDHPAPTLSEVEARRRRYAEMRERFGAWGWWEGDLGGRLTPPPSEAVEVDPAFAEAVLAVQRGAATWTLREVDGQRFVDRSTGIRPTPADVTTFAKALAGGESAVLALVDRLREIAEVEAEVESRHMDARAELRAVGDDGELLLALFADDRALREAAEARAADLAASWRRRIASEPERLAALPPAGVMSLQQLAEAAGVVCEVRGWSPADLARAVALPAHSLESFLAGAAHANPAIIAKLRPLIAARQGAAA